MFLVGTSNEMLAFELLTVFRWRFDMEDSAKPMGVDRQAVIS